MSIELQATSLSREAEGASRLRESVQNSPSPGGAQDRPRRVFDVAPSNVLSRKSRLLISALVISANLVQFISNFLTFAGGFSITRSLGLNLGPGEANWMAAGYSLTQGTFVLISGRLGAVYGHQRVLLIGGAILVTFSLANGFCKSYVSFIAMRALTGVGGGLIMPNAVAMITTMVPPGRSRNVAMGFFGSSAPIGSFIGCVLAGVFVELVSWEWMFFFVAAFAAAVFLALALVLPREQPVDKGGRIDYTGAFLGLSSLLIFNFVWNQAPRVGWSTPYEGGWLGVSIILFAMFLGWEHKFAKDPIMPLAIFKTPTFSALVFVVLLSYMSFAISLWYMVAWQQLIRGWSILQLTAGWSPFAISATAAVGLAAWLIPRLAAQWIMAIGITAVLLSNILLATMPEQQIYWAQTFPAIVFGSICPDFVYVAAQIIASNSVSRRDQGIAGSLIGTLNLYGGSLSLGFAGTIETELAKRLGEASSSSVLPYRAVLYFGFGLAVASLLLDLAFVRVPKDMREGWEAESDGDPANDVGAVVAVGTASSVEMGHNMVLRTDPA